MYICKYIHVQIYTCANIYIYKFIHVQIYTCANIYICANIYMCKYIHVYTYICIHVMHALVSRWRKAIDVDGYYVEK